MIQAQLCSLLHVLQHCLPGRGLGGEGGLGDGGLGWGGRGGGCGGFGDGGRGDGRGGGLGGAGPHWLLLAPQHELRVLYALPAGGMQALAVTTLGLMCLVQAAASSL